MPTLRLQLKRRRVRIGVCALLLMAVSSIALSDASLGSPPPRAPAAHGRVTRQSRVRLATPFSVLADRTVLRHAVAVVMPKAVVQGLTNFAAYKAKLGRPVPEVSQAAYAGQFPWVGPAGRATTEVWVMPRSDGGVCIAPLLGGRLAGLLCGTPADAGSGAVVVTTLDSQNATIDALGIAPNGNSSVVLTGPSGSTDDVPVTNNIWSEYGFDATAVRAIAADGQLTTNSLLPGAGAGS